MARDSLVYTFITIRSVADFRFIYTAASYGSIHIAFGAYGVLGKFLAGLLFGALLIIFVNIAVTMVAQVMFNLSVTLIGYVRD